METSSFLDKDIKEIRSFEELISDLDSIGDTELASRIRQNLDLILRDLTYSDEQGKMKHMHADRIACSSVSLIRDLSRMYKTHGDNLGNEVLKKLFGFELRPFIPDPKSVVPHEFPHERKVDVADSFDKESARLVLRDKIDLFRKHQESISDTSIKSQSHKFLAKLRSLISGTRQ